MQVQHHWGVLCEVRQSWLLVTEDLFWLDNFVSVSGVDGLEPRPGQVLRPVVVLEVVVHRRVLDRYRLHRLEWQ